MNPLHILLLFAVGLVAGVLNVLAGGGSLLTLPVLLFLGLLGGFTTFSSFSYETLQLLRGGQWGLAGLNVAAQLLLGLTAVWLGWGLGHLPGVGS